VKRSEMLDALAWYLEEKYDLEYRASEQILDFLERQGMQPPKRIKYAPTAYAEPNKRIVYEWEDEE
jgi:hypothetical protein